MQEQGLRLSELSDQQAGFEVGKLLPASLLLSGQILQKEGRVMLGVRLVDTSTSRYLATVDTPLHKIEDMGGVLSKLVGELAEKARQAHPLTATLTLVGGEARAAVGAFQRATPGMRFSILPRPVPGGFLAQSAASLGEAAILDLGQTESRVSLTWKDGHPPENLIDLIIREMPEKP